MNAGNMGIPLALFAFGPAGMQRATLLYVFTAFLQYSLGLYILNGRANWIEILRLPLIYAAIGGVTSTSCRFVFLKRLRSQLTCSARRPSHGC